mmetsp:Transcript_62807/g.134868  ORF Transcript_62807/g.134868 Transcript_62807/m.134868 type:complete len:262 (-) Transcript_62807:273-1058(-)
MQDCSKLSSRAAMPKALRCSSKSGSLANGIKMRSMSRRASKGPWNALSFWRRSCPGKAATSLSIWSCSMGPGSRASMAAMSFGPVRGNVFMTMATFCASFWVRTVSFASLADEQHDAVRERRPSALGVLGRKTSAKASQSSRTLSTLSSKSLSKIVRLPRAVRAELASSPASLMHNFRPRGWYGACGNSPTPKRSFGTTGILPRGEAKATSPFDGMPIPGTMPFAPLAGGWPLPLRGGALPGAFPFAGPLPPVFPPLGSSG